VSCDCRAGFVTGMLTLPRLAEYLSAKIVLYDKREKIVDGLYLHNAAQHEGQAPPSAFGDGQPLMNELDDIMDKIMTQVVEGQRDSACMELYRRFLESIEYVVLAHDEYRIYDQSLPFMVKHDLEKLMEFFNCDGEGLPMEELENLKYDIDSILDFCGWDSPTLAERYQGFKQEEDELGSFNSRGGLGM